MVLKIEKLAWENEQWMTVAPDGFKCSLASQQDCKTIFILRDSYWDEVYCGKVVNYEGEIKGQPYTGPVIPVQCGGENTGLMIPVPTAQPGKWYAVHWHEQNVYYELQPEMLIRNPQSTDYAGGTYDKAPCEKCVGTILHHRGTTIPVKPGKVALDLANLPFPKEYWFFLDGAYQESDLEIFLEPEDMDLTRQMIGEIKMQVLFWLF